MKRTSNSKIEREKVVINADNKILGRLSVEIANILRGKNKVNFVYNQDIGDFVEIINPDKIRVTGNKLMTKIYYRHSGYIGNLRQLNLKDALLKNPELVIRHAVKGMLPSNRLQKKWLSRLTFKYQKNIEK